MGGQERKEEEKRKWVEDNNQHNTANLTSKVHIVVAGVSICTIVIVHFVVEYSAGVC